MKVQVKTPARLHLGLIDLNGDLGRLFGGIGVAIDHPNVILEAESSERFSVEGDTDHLVESLAQRFFSAYKTQSFVKIRLLQSIPSHIGLGSGTQIALATAAALSKILNVNSSMQNMSLAMGRVKRTGVGTAIFLNGGFVVDSGKLIEDGKIDPENFPPVTFQQPFPTSWNFVVAIPTIKKGLANNEEISAFKKLSPMAHEEVGKICRLMMMQLLPALFEKNIREFGEALTKIQVITGNYFATAQGGTYASDASADCVEMMKKFGAFGVGQSSWGPALYALVEDKDAEKIRSKVKAYLAKGVGGEVFVARPNNEGATIKFV